MQGESDLTIQYVLTLHNRERQMVGVEPLQWDFYLEILADDWASSCSKTNSLANDPEWLIHYYTMLSGQPPTGNSIGESRVYGADISPMSAQAWFYQKTDWDCATDSCVPNKVCDRYRQAVWSETTQIGCVIRNCSDYDKILVCMYANGGNRPPPARPFPSDNCGETYAPLQPINEFPLGDVNSNPPEPDSLEKQYLPTRWGGGDWRGTGTNDWTPTAWRSVADSPQNSLGAEQAYLNNSPVLVAIVVLFVVITVILVVLTTVLVFYSRQ